MADDERDEEWFKEVYGKEYTGPSSRSRGRHEDSAKNKAGKRSGEVVAAGAESEEEEAPRDPNAVPTDFTSREAKVWEAKAKAIERNWKRRKEEELHCKICGEPGHFAQGCPSTLGGKRKPSSEVVERVALRDKRLKPRLIGTGGSVIQGIEKESGCRLKLEDNNGHGGGGGVYHVRVSGPDRVAVSKAVNAVRKLADQFEDEWNRNSSSKRHKSSSGFVDERAGFHYTDSKRDWGAIQVVNGGTGRTVKLRDEYLRGRGGGQENGGSYQASRRQGYEQDVKGSSAPSLEELEQSFLQEAVELSKEQSTEEEREISRHRQCMREIQEQYEQKMMNLRTKQGLEREEFVRQQYYDHHQHHHHQPEQESGYLYEASHANAYASSYGGYDYQLRNSSPSFAYGRNSPYHQRHH